MGEQPASDPSALKTMTVPVVRSVSLTTRLSASPNGWTQIRSAPSTASPWVLLNWRSAVGGKSPAKFHDCALRARGKTRKRESISDLMRGGGSEWVEWMRRCRGAPSVGEGR